MRDDATKRRGRPALVQGQKAECVQVRLPTALHDRACQIALREGVSVSAVVRVALARMVGDVATSTTSTA